MSLLHLRFTWLWSLWAIIASWHWRPPWLSRVWAVICHICGWCCCCCCCVFSSLLHHSCHSFELTHPIECVEFRYYYYFFSQLIHQLSMFRLLFSHWTSSWHICLKFKTNLLANLLNPCKRVSLNGIALLKAKITAFIAIRLLMNGPSWKSEEKIHCRMANWGKIVRVTNI